ncbi:MAG: caspase family protein [Alphaproteobacteria bacterium]|nr:caspase family protein [Alphaproteobacteria bacterium]
MGRTLQILRCWAVSLAGALLLVAGSAFAEDDAPEKLALLIANSAYLDDYVGTLPGVPHDREKMEAALKEIGFHVTVLADGTQAQMQAAFADFRQRLADAPEDSTGFIYYTGHGIGSGAGQDYFIPVNLDITQISRGQSMTSQSVSVEDALAQMVFDGPRQLVLAFDTNRAYIGQRSKGIGQRDTPKELRLPEIYQLWATRIGDYAYETPEGSYFSQALADALREPGLTVTEIFARVQSETIEASEGQQFPEAIISTSRPLILFEGKGGKDTGSAAAPTKSVPLVQSSASGAPRAESVSQDLALELAVWQSAVSLNSIEAMSDFIEKFPDSVLVDQARLRLKALSLRAPAGVKLQAGFEHFMPTRKMDGPARIALLIGNRTYAPNLNDLTNPHNDVQLMKDRLIQAGFEVFLYRDADPDEMGLSLSNLATRLSKEPKEMPPTVFFYYSGHGFAPDPNGPNYLAPVGMKLTSETDLIRALSIEKVIEYVQAFEPSFAFYVLDACRNDPGLPAGNGTKSVSASKGLSRVDWVGGALVAYATAPGETAFDAPEETVGPYARALADALSQPGMDATDVFKTAQRTVYFESRKTQTPWISDGLMQDFYFHPAEDSAQSSESN